MTRRTRWNCFAGALAGALIMLGTPGCPPADNPDASDLTLQIAGSGSIQVTPGDTYASNEVPVTIPFDSATLVQLTAIPSTGATFVQWTGDVTGTTNPIVVPVDGEVQVSAVFTQSDDDNDGDDDDDDDNPDVPTDLTETDIQQDTVIPAGVYRVSDDIIVYNGATLTLEPGVRLEFARGQRLLIEDDGAAEFIGTATSPIVLTGEDPTPGYWYGLVFSDSNSTSNILEYVTVEYAGVEDDESTGNISFDFAARAVLDHCTLRHSASVGLAFRENADDGRLTLSACTLTDNAMGPAKVLIQQIGALNATSTFSGNGEDRILVGAGSDQSLESDQLWSALDVDYELTSNLTLYAHLTIEPGVRIMFRTNRALAVEEEGTLTAIGTADDPIVFTAVDPTPGYWRGIIFSGSNSVSNTIQYFVCEYGGQFASSTWGTFTIWDNSRVQIDHGDIRYSEGWGIWLRGANHNADIATANTFANNTEGDVHIEE